jgi:hypothetical protein
VRTTSSLLRTGRVKRKSRKIADNRKLLRRRRGVVVGRRGGRVVEYQEKLAEDSECDHKHLRSISDCICMCHLAGPAWPRVCAKPAD